MLLIKDATIFEDNKESKVDLLIEDAKIVKIAKDLNYPHLETIEADGLYLIPSIIDLNIRLKDDKFSIDHIQRLVKKAKRSGVSKVVLMPDFTPSIENERDIELLISKLSNFDIDIIISVKATKQNDSRSLNDIAIMSEYGARIIQEESSVDGNILRRVFQYSIMKDMPFFCFCNNPILNDNGVMHEGEVSSKLGLSGISKISEISEVAKVAYMSEYYNSKTLFQSLTTSKSIEIVNELKKSNSDIFCEVSISHLILNDSECDEFNTLAKISPPLRDEQERLKLIGALKDGKIDTITSLHSSRSFNSKDVAFNDASYGVDSLEYLLSLSYTYLVKEGVIDIYKLIELLSKNPAKVLGLEDECAIREGSVANFILFDPKKRYIVNDKENLFFNRELFGEVVANIIDGRVVN